jgi:hypothetical protein
MKKLLKEYQLSSIEDYYCIIRDSYVNGQRKQSKEQSKEQFNAMPKANRVEFVKEMLFDHSNHLAGAEFFFNALHNL